MIVLGPPETQLTAISLFAIVYLAIFGWYYAEKVTLRPMDKTYKEVVVGCFYTLLGEWILSLAAANYFSISFWIFALITIPQTIIAWGITGGLMIYWQQWKHSKDDRDEMEIITNRSKQALRDIHGDS